MNVGAHAMPCRASSSTALWLLRSKSMLVQEIQPAKDIDLTCSRLKATKCLQVEPMSLDWPVDPIADSINPDFLLP